MKIGFVVTAHHSDDYRKEGGYFIERFCNSLNDNCKYKFNLYVVDNASEYKLNLPNNAILLRINNQMIGGITYAWNFGINRAYEDGCDIIINCNDDLWFNDTINILINYIINHNDNNAIYSGLTNGTLGCSQLSSGPKSGIQIKKGHDILNGFCFAMTRDHYELFRFENDKYFNVNNKYNGGDGKWGGQEGQFMENSERGLYGIVVNDCFIPHTKVRGWKQLKGK
jgi:hypothetical protein